jgi:hypothetical protein
MGDAQCKFIDISVNHPVMNFVTTRLLSFPLSLVAISLLEWPGAIAMPSASPVNPADEPMDFLDQPDGIVNCVVSATANTVPWDHRFTYWLSGVAQFDDQGNMLAIPVSRNRDWVLTVTNSRFSTPDTYNLSVLGAWSPIPRFTFPAVSEEEWNTLGQRPTPNYTTVFSYEESAHGLYVAIRNTEAAEQVRQMVQVIHNLGEGVILVSDAAPCFIGPRPPAPADQYPSLERPNL